MGMILVRREFKQGFVKADVSRAVHKQASAQRTLIVIIGNRTLCHPVLSIIILVINQTG